MKGSDIASIGIVKGQSLVVKNYKNSEIIKSSINDLKGAWQATLGALKGGAQ
jgi:hypothetical protein